jgi:hypothetical protein
MSKRLVDVFDKSGARLFSYSIALEDESCIEAEFEEVALIFAERSGLVAEADIAHLVARCDASAVELAIEDLQPTIHAAVPPAKAPRKKSTVVSLIKHKMKKAAATSAQHARNRA